MRRAGTVACLAVVAMVLSGCRSTSSPAGSPPSRETPVAGSPAPVASSWSDSRVVDPRLDQVGDAGQAIVVTADTYGLSTASLTAYERQAGRWQPVMGPWTARIGNNGFAPPGEKVEGDGRTPSGVYGFEFFFGVAPDPGVRFEYRQVPDDTIIWDEDPESPTYNLWIDLDDYGGGNEPEGMYQPVAYRHGAVIAYNTDRTPGLGSGIFLHASTDEPTAGCVSLPLDQLVAILRWLDPAQTPRILMGVSS